MADATTARDVEQIAIGADRAADVWASTSATERGRVLRAVADALDDAAGELIPIAMAETNLAEGRLAGELRRTTFQLRIFAETLEEGGYLDVRIDHADDGWPMGAPRPDLRRSLISVGPVVVFAASNFPFAFSVAGGDTASALAAGSSVILKAHSGHPGLSQRTAEIVGDALAGAGAPAGVFAVIFGTEAGRLALQHPLVKAGAFTGSIAGGRALFDLAQSRPEPIPFYGELGSVNPVFVTRAAASARGESIAEEFVGSFTLGAGQFCTKPGILFVPRASDLASRLAGSTLPPAAKLLNARIQSGFLDALADVRSHAAVRVLCAGDDATDGPPAPTLLATDIAALLDDPQALLAEVFGPAALVVEYDDEAQLLDVARVLEGQLTATIVGEDEDQIAPELIRLLAKKAGRVLWNQWPTGVSVTYAQQHGGPYPATTASASTSVGTAAITRFLRPVAFQGLPQHLLAAELRDENELGIRRRVNGALG
ncbi:aldehyde dehydrogenase (NADP(+)) [Microterricola viridarii]|uniref:NADP-dependent aldehyde dehydrogenase n=1 Tax=Microterricola viridarii TaxID=412690 RepID=A0A1H1MNC6_9MICO|nr:aldehyde dehydrogenase (NADP(+)) [Microterricola viridarii]SDR88217.1 NADP-dependent aldehyde dehydrogenase [Microterricola viridarii]